MEARSQLRHRPTMTNLPIFVESARFVISLPCARCFHRDDLKADGAAGGVGFVGLAREEVTEE